MLLPPFRAPSGRPVQAYGPAPLPTRHTAPQLPRPCHGSSCPVRTAARVPLCAPARVSPDGNRIASIERDSLQPYAPGRALVNGRPGASAPPLQLPSFPGFSAGRLDVAVTRIDSAFKASGRAVVITGGSQGIGRATALLFARKGFNVIVSARDLTKLQYVASDCEEACGRQGSSLAVPCDVTNQDQVKSLAAAVGARFQSIDCVVNCAGIMTRGAFADVPVLEAERVMRTNMFGAYNVSQAFLPMLQIEGRRKRGADKPSLIMLNSFTGKVPMKNMSAFSASKFALYGLTEALRAEVAQDNIHVGQVYPGVVKSNHLERTTFYGESNQEERRNYRNLVRALPIAQQPQQVADAVWSCYSGKHNDTVVGLPFAAAAVVNQLTGANPFLSAMVPF